MQDKKKKNKKRIVIKIFIENASSTNLSFGNYYIALSTRTDIMRRERGGRGREREGEREG